MDTNKYFANKPSNIETLFVAVLFQIPREKDNCTNIAARVHCVFVAGERLKETFLKKRYMYYKI